MIRLVIADDHPVVRAGLEGMLDTQADFEVVGTAADGEAAVEVVADREPDVALMDLRMPKLSGLEAIRALRERCPEVGILVLTTYDSDADIDRALEAGVLGYILKDTPRDKLFDAVRRVARGERVLSPRVRERLGTRSPAPLSPRELEVLVCLSRGEGNRAIARRLFISEATVKTHLLHIFAKLGVSQRTAAVTEALRRGMIRLDEE